MTDSTTTALALGALTFTIVQSWRTGNLLTRWLLYTAAVFVLTLPETRAYLSLFLFATIFGYGINLLSESTTTAGVAVCLAACIVNCLHYNLCGGVTGYSIFTDGVGY